MVKVKMRTFMRGKRLNCFFSLWAVDIYASPILSNVQRPIPTNIFCAFYTKILRFYREKNPELKWKGPRKWLLS